MSIERRRTVRAPCDLPCHWRRGLRTIECRVRDLNVHGLFLLTHHVCALNYVMDLVITLPSGPLEVLGVARFVGASRHGHGIGVAVHAISPEDRERWMVFYRAAVSDLLATMPAEIARHLR